VERSAVHPKTFPLMASVIIILNKDVSEKPFTFIRIIYSSYLYLSLYRRFLQLGLEDVRSFLIANIDIRLQQHAVSHLGRIVCQQ
jgi:hypothetical protein